MSKRDRKFYIPFGTQNDEGSQELKVVVSYDEGGMNYFNGRVNKKGFSVIFRPVNVKADNGFQIESFEMMDNKAYSVFLEEAGRYNEKKLDVLSNKIKNRQKDEVMELYKSKDINQILAVFK